MYRGLLFEIVCRLLCSDMWRYMELLNQSLVTLGNSLKGTHRDAKKMQSVRMTLKPGRRHDTPSRKALEEAREYESSFN